MMLCRHFTEKYETYSVADGLVLHVKFEKGRT